VWTHSAFQLNGFSTGTPDLLVVLILVSAGLVLLSLGFAFVAIGSHVWRRVQSRHRTARTTRWRAQLLEVLAGEASPQSVTDQVEASQSQAFLRFLLPYATTVQGRESERIEALARPYVDRLRRKLRSRWPLIRAQATQWIGILGGPEQADVLRAALDDPSDQVVEIAFRRLARLSHLEDAERLLSCLDRLTHVDRRRISSALVKLGEESAAPLRAAMADADRLPFVRICCAEALRWLGDTEAAPIAARLLREAFCEPETTDPELTASLLRVLRAVGQDDHRSLVRRFCQSPVPFVRIHAARALGQLGTQADEDLLCTLVEEDNSRWVALSAAQSLVDLGRTESLRVLQTADHPRATLAANLLGTPSL